MKSQGIKTQLKLGDTVTSLYHSPFDFNLLYILLLAKTGLKLRVIIDDIDNLGVTRSPENNKNQSYTYADKYFVSKTERTNLRSLAFTLPKHLFANLSIPELKALDNKISIKQIKHSFGYEDTVEHWIRDTTTQFGSRAIVGPDKSFGFQRVTTDLISSIQDAIRHLKSLVSVNFPQYSDEALTFIDWLFQEVNQDDTISDYFVHILERIIDRFELKDSVTIEKMSNSLIERKTRDIYQKFISNDSFRAIYKNAVEIDGKKDSLDIPFYAISKKDGSRLLDAELAVDNAPEYIIAPKVLMLNNLKNLVLPIEAMGKSNVQAREIIYRSGFTEANQVFCASNFLSEISKLISDVRLSPVEERIYGVNDFPSLHELIQFLENEKSLYQHGATDNELELYKRWVATSTLGGLYYFGYPLLFLCLLQEKAFCHSLPEFFKIDQIA